MVGLGVSLSCGLSACSPVDPAPRPGGGGQTGETTGPDLTDSGPTEPGPRGRTTGPHLDARRYYEDYRGVDYAYSGAADGGALSAVDAEASMPMPSAEVLPGPASEPGFEPGPLDDNTFTDVGDSGWIEVEQAPESTFGLDVDTASYSVARTFLDHGHRPDPDSIRIEEWVNSFSYGDPAPTESALGLQVESGPAPQAPETTLVRIGVSTLELSPEERPPANITFVVDTSGSMDIRERLGLVQSSLALLVNTLGPEDTIAIVIYGDDASPLLEPTPVSEVDTIVAAIEDLVPGGSTNMEAGLRMAYEQARASQRASQDEETVNVVLLASDGVANVGVAEGEALVEEIIRAGEEGIHLVTVGYGMGNYNDTLMEQLANSGDGFYAYVDTFEEAERLFVEELTPTLTVVARDTKAQVNFDGDQVARYRLLGYENRLLDAEDFTDDSVDAGELGAGHQVSALYEVQPLGQPTPGDVLGSVALRWLEPRADEAQQLDVDITWPAFGDGADSTQTDGQTSEVREIQTSDSLRLAALIADTAQLLKGSPEAVNRGYSLADLRAEAQDLQDRGVDGAAEFADFLHTVDSIPLVPESPERPQD